MVFNPHFSHPASNYTKRLSEIKQAAETDTPEKFFNALNAGRPEPVDGLILYTDRRGGDYLFFYWRDNFPNGGEEDKIIIKRSLVSPKFWQAVYDNGAWSIWLKR